MAEAENISATEDEVINQLNFQRFAVKGDRARENLVGSAWAVISTRMIVGKYEASGTSLERLPEEF